MQITRATDYAVRLTIHLATVTSAGRVSSAALARAISAPESFVSKVLQRLVQSGLITSRRGMRGGFQLSRRASEISLLNVVEVMDGPTRINLCVPNGQNCERKSWCGAHPVWVKAQAALTGVLGGVSIAALAQRSASNLERLRGIAAARGAPASRRGGPSKELIKTL